MGKRIIFTEDESALSTEIEMFLNDKGNVAIVIKYEDDSDADIRVIQLSPEDFREMVSIVNIEIEQNLED